LPDAAKGTLTFDGQPVTAGQEIPAGDIGKLVFEPAKDFNGDVDFRYTVSDGLKDSGEATGAIQVAAVNDTSTVSQADAVDDDQITDTTASITANEQEDDTENVDHDQSSPPPPADEMEFDLDNVGKLLDAQPKVATSGMEDVLKSAATLLDDTQSDSKEAAIVDAVENQAPKEAVPNPDAPTQDATSADGSNVQDDSVGEYIPDTHNIVDDQHQNDGSGITG